MSRDNSPETEPGTEAIPSEPAKPPAIRQRLRGARAFWRTQVGPLLQQLWSLFRKWIAVAGAALFWAALTMIDIGEYGFAVAMLLAAFVAFAVQIKNAPNISEHATGTTLLKASGCLVCFSVVLYFVGVAYMKAQSGSWSNLAPRNKSASITQNPAPTPLTIAAPPPQPTATATPSPTPSPTPSSTPSPTPSPSPSPTPPPKPTRSQQREEERLRQEALKALNLNKAVSPRP